jgi:hypothetical protein
MLPACAQNTTIDFFNHAKQLMVQVFVGHETEFSCGCTYAGNVPGMRSSSRVVGMSRRKLLSEESALKGNSGGNYAVYPRVVATVIALAPRGLATIRTSDGVTPEVLTGTTWRGGATVTCEHTARRQTA